MATETGAQREVAAETLSGNWRAGVVGGLAGGLVFGAVLSVMATAVIEVAIPSLYALAPPANGTLGWVVHMSHAAVLGVVFAAVVDVAGWGERSSATLAGAGLAYGVVLWVVLAVLVMPVWLDAVGSPANPPLPNVSYTSLLGHLAYGVVLGAVYAAARDL
ncbi:DUF6789 family protein [Halobacterium litoreum]|uniref:DUF6789 family protein n=1 Tax=Halobacterium litoreum TaxID=2039234 RepID=A0ABD5ND22_9EURY|nr:DUF6789 family protein [Halobacterium litoreum]UHH13945.1 histidine kinase [Halobacterium litoreum]